MILTALFAEPAKWWSVPDLAGRLELPQASVRRCLSLLEGGGVARVRQDSGRKVFQPDPGCPVYLELQSLMTKLSAQHYGHGETILVVEDQAATARITRILLESWGYRVLEAHSGAEALRMFDERGKEIELLLTDVTMPEMTGTQLADELERRKPGLRIIFMSGYTAEAVNGREVEFLPKPFNPASLARVVRNQLRTAD